MDRAVAAARDGVRRRARGPGMTHAERAEYLRALGRRAARPRRRPRRRSGPASRACCTPWRQYAGTGAAARRSTTTPAWPTRSRSRSRPRRPPAASSGCSSASRSGVVGAIIPWNAPLSLIANKVAPGAARRLHRRAQGVAGGARRGLRRRRGRRGDRPAARRAQRRSPPTARSPSCWSATPGSTRSPSPARPPPAGGSPRSAASASPAARSSSAASRPRSSSTTSTSATAADDAGRRRVLPHRPGVLVADPDRRHPQPPRRAGRGAGRPRSRRCKVGDPFDPATQMGPLVAERQRDRVAGYIAKGVEEGATLVTGGGRPAHLDRGWFVEPTVFGNVDNSLDHRPGGDLRAGAERHPRRRRAGRRPDRQRHDLRPQRLGVHPRRRPGPRGRRAAALGHRRATTPSAPTSASPSAASSSPASAARAASRACCPFLETKTVILEGTPSRYA